jgi:outer membrane receptor protein involved in Fe transport
MGKVFGINLVRVGLLIALCGTLAAQITGELRGTVVDASGASVVQAKVTLKSVETGQTREQTVNAEGVFTFNLLQIGDYDVRAEAPGFNSSATRLLVKTGEIATVQFKLDVGQVTETVSVSGVVSKLDTESAQLQTSVVGEQIQEIPVNRNPNIFALTAPGVAPVSANNPFLGSGSFNSNGGRGRGNNITVDGITATDVSVTGTGGPLGPLNFSSIKEVKVITNNFSAEYGRNASSQVLYITKNGTNALHGELYEYFENDKLNARSFFDRSGRANILRQNTYGFELGGPVYIPKLFNGQNRVFWHVDYEGFKGRGQGAAVVGRVPTPAQLATVTDPTSLGFVKQYNLVTDPSGQIRAQAPSTTNSYQVSYRGDVNLTKNDNLWARYAVFDSKANSTGLTFIDTNLPGFGASSTNHPREATLAETHLFGASAVNEFRFGFGQSKPSFPINTPYPLGPRINFLDASVDGQGVSSILPQGREQRTYQYTDNFTFTRGTHNIKLGGELYNLDADSIFDSNIRPIINFNNFADFAAGRPASFTQNFGNSVRANRVKNFFAFVQDDWKATRNLTLNIGLRAEWAGGPTEANKIISNLNLNNHAAFGAAGAGPLGLLETGKPSFNSNTNWGPRFGFAYTPRGSQKTVIRGGYGIAYDFIFLNPITNQRFLPPYIISGALSGTGSFTGDNSFARVVAGTSAIQSALAAQVGSLSTTTLNFGAVSPAIAQNLRNPQVQQWNLGVQREVLGLVFKASYVGTKGTYLPRTRPINLNGNPVAPATSLADEQARLPQFVAAFRGLSGGPTAFSNRLDPRYNAVNYVESSANSSYHALQLEAQKRFSKGLFLNVAYTFAKSIDDNSDVLGVLINDTSAQQDPRNNRNNRAPSQFDLRHVLVVTHDWELPWFKNSSHLLVKEVLGGWGFSGISTFRTGFPVNLFAGPRLGLTDPIVALGGVAVDRPNINGPVSFNPKPAGSAGSPFGVAAVNGVNVSTYATSLGLSQPLLGNFGNLGRNSFRLNGLHNFDWNVYKNFRIGERANFQLRGEFYNLFNNVSFSTVTNTITSASFGDYTTVAQNARTIQLGARFVF